MLFFFQLSKLINNSIIANAVPLYARITERNKIIGRKLMKNNNQSIELLTIHFLQY